MRRHLVQMRRLVRLAFALLGPGLVVVGACTEGSDSEPPVGAAGSGPQACAPEGAAVYCYPGPATSRGVGECHDGTIRCEAGYWTECEGHALPGEEICDDDLDNDCDGVADEGCPCQSGTIRTCYTGPGSARGIGICRDGEQLCVDAAWAEECEGQVLPEPDEPCNELDDNCNGVVDDGCACTTGVSRSCYSGAPSTLDVGLCHGGTQQCVGGQWETTCAGELVPAPEQCNLQDDDCDGSIDEELGTTTCGDGPCARTVDNCVGGQPQSCEPLCDGVNCTAGSQCATGFCKDGRCCNSACTSPCQLCVTGTCSPVLGGYDDPECTGTNSCDAAGACKKVTGQPCSSASECVTGYCKDGHCCNNACTSPCQSCATGSCSTVANADDDPECTGTNSCDASGVCKKDNGQTCSSPTECLSGYCKDGRCCNNACASPCQSCATGSCATVVNAVDNPECSGTSSCDSAGSCRKVNGQTCSSPTECVSGYCKDGRCCNNACTTACRTCANSSGTCSNVANADDSPECTGTNTCNASAVCKKKSGQLCTFGTECASGVCSCDKYGTCTCY